MDNKWQNFIDTIVQESQEALEQRLKNNPVPTKLEWVMGTFVEELEYQTRDAILEFNQKGYNTDSSGIDFSKPNWQVVDGCFHLDKDTIQKLRDFGVEIEERNNWIKLRFYCNEPDLEKIKARWDEIAGVLPDRGEAASLNNNLASEEFREKYPRS